jgi:hypothetical protein
LPSRSRSDPKRRAATSEPRTTDPLPDEFVANLHQLAARYLASEDPYLQSGFGGGPERWRSEREPILDAVTGDGDLLDLGCANGLLLECLVAWAEERDLTLTPYGLDKLRPLDVVRTLTDAGFTAWGSSSGGSDRVSVFAWTRGRVELDALHREPGAR